MLGNSQECRWLIVAGHLQVVNKYVHLKWSCFPLLLSETTEFIITRLPMQPVAWQSFWKIAESTQTLEAEIIFEFFIFFCGSVQNKHIHLTSLWHITSQRPSHTKTVRKNTKVNENLLKQDWNSNKNRRYDPLTSQLESLTDWTWEQTISSLRTDWVSQLQTKRRNGYIWTFHDWIRLD